MMPKKWHSFGKSANPAGYGTLLHYAKQGGYCEPITFVYDGSLGFVDDEVANGEMMQTLIKSVTINHL